jgi:hypothetical protein
MSKTVLILVYSFCGTRDIHRVLFRYRVTQKTGTFEKPSKNGRNSTKTFY